MSAINELKLQFESFSIRVEAFHFHSNDKWTNHAANWNYMKLTFQINRNIAYRSISWQHFINILFFFCGSPKLVTAGSLSLVFCCKTEKLNKSAVKFNYRPTNMNEKNSNIDGCNIVLISGYIREDVINCVDFPCNTVDN